MISLPINSNFQWILFSDNITSVDLIFTWTEYLTEASYIKLYPGIDFAANMWCTCKYCGELRGRSVSI